MLMIPVLFNISAAPFAPVIPPVTLSVEPASAPSVAPAATARMIWPLAVFVVAPKLCKAPAESRPLPVSVRRLLTFAPPAICSAAPFRATVTNPAPEPSALPLCTRTAPALMRTGPIHGATPGLLFAVINSTPFSPLIRPLLSEPSGSVKGDATVNVLPPVTSMVFCGAPVATTLD